MGDAVPRYLALSTFDTPGGETVVADDLEAAYDAAPVCGRHRAEIVADTATYRGRHRAVENSSDSVATEKSQLESRR